MMFLEELGLKESGLDRLIKAGYHLLGLISYLTAGKPEVRAWTITRGTKAPQAAGKIHSDFERGFIRAEIVAYDDLGTESIKRLTVRDLPLTVALDAQGGDAYAMGVERYRELCQNP